MIKINKNFEIQLKNIFLKVYQKKNTSNGSWNWLNNEKVTKYMDKGYVKNTKSKQLKYFNEISKSKKDILFAIYFFKKHIGNVGLHKINFNSRSAQFGIIIGDTKYHGKGIGKIVWSKIIEFAFEDLNLKIIKTMITEKNIPSTNIAKRLGFKKMKRMYFIKKKNEKLKYPKYYLIKKNFKKI